MVDTPVLGTGANAWEFESLHAQIKVPLGFNLTGFLFCNERGEKPRFSEFERGVGIVCWAYLPNNNAIAGKAPLPFNRTFGRKLFMLLRGRKPEAIQLLPIYKGRKWVEYKSPKCPVLVMKMSTNLHILSQ